MNKLLLSLFAGITSAFAQAPMAQPPTVTQVTKPTRPEKPVETPSKPKEVPPDVAVSYLSLQVKALASDLKSKDAQIKYLQTLLDEVGGSGKITSDLTALTERSGCDKLVAQSQDNPAPTCVSYPKPAPPTQK